MLTNVRSDRVRSVRSLSRRSVRERTGRFVVDGPQGVREAIRYAAERVDDLYVTGAAAQRHSDLVDAAHAARVRVHDTDEAVLAAMSDTESPQGLLAVVATESPTLDDVLARTPRLLVLLSSVRDPGNAGTVIRGADAFGADAVLVTEGSVDVHSPKVVRSTVGSIFHLPVVTGLDVTATLDALAAHGIRTLAADGAGTTLLPDADLDGPHAWVMGNEAWGLPEEVKARCADVVRVPIHDRVESLNLAMAATVCLAASSGATRPR
ncbi:TrmH family RNA methyltransferase [Knoellia remsis]|uniref:TrmH family RNA methyltransferase n=1 Tax=Knoellia remsis TaxID=407159 RepID=A0A2T0V0V6_9MICO|nr:RNA methyltransferase [Knoellia remsis]PRY63791.1 TrmH family RNA methyltransferase [Knoellia remsis]